jgi:hypothetical protein
MTALPAAAGVVFWIKNAALGAILGGTVLAVAVVPKLRSERAIEASQAASARSAVRKPTNKVKPVPVAVAPLADAAPEPSVEPAPAPVHTTTANIAPAASVFTPAELARETHLLEQARQLLGSNPSRTLDLLNQHQREFKNGALQVERELLAVDALLRLGRRAEAQKRAAQLRTRNPGSIYDRRLSQLMGESVEN